MGWIQQNMGLVVGFLLFSGLSIFVISLFFRNNNAKTGWVGVGTMLVQLLLSVAIGNYTIQHSAISLSFTWIELINTSLELGVYITNEAAILLCIVALVALLVFLFSMVYMKKDKAVGRYFSFLGLFVFAMNGIILSDNLLMLFIFWELVGFSSYLLIGFWFEKTSASKAALKAFLMNKIGDIGFLIGIMILWSLYGTLSLTKLQNLSPNLLDFWVIVAGFGLIMGTIGKSAQFPLSTWLPDAMEGPTPVSALIHAATMVAAGIYLLTRIFFLLALPVLDFLAVIGAVTLVLAAIAAMRQSDIKKVLAFSTISQLGYMVMGIGVGGYEVALFHLITHAFFKAGLFLAAGSIIHHLHEAFHKREALATLDAQNMWNMGELRKSLPITYVTFLICALALMGVPLFSGFMSKDAIIHQALEWAMDSGGWKVLVPAIGFIGVGCTAYYVVRQIVIVFFVKSSVMNESDLNEIKEKDWYLLLPLVVLSVGAFWFVYALNPFNFTTGWLAAIIPNKGLSFPVVSHVYSTIFSLLFLFMGSVVAYMQYGKRGVRVMREEKLLGSTFFYRISEQNWFQDRAIEKIVVNPTLRLSKLNLAFEKNVVNRAVEVTGVFVVLLSKVIQIFDRLIIDFFVNVMAQIIGKIGQFLRSFQNGKVQLYIAYGFLLLLSLLFILILI